MCVFIHSGTVKADPYVLKPMKELINSVNDLSNELILFDEFTSENIYEFLLNDLYEGEIDINELTIYSYGKNESPYLTYYGMVNVIKDCPDKFLYYNNGIKIAKWITTKKLIKFCIIWIYWYKRIFNIIVIQRNHEKYIKIWIFY